MTVPAYLTSYAAKYAADPRGANRAWFGNARKGLFMHFGLYSLLGRADHDEILKAVGITHPVEHEPRGREWAQYGYRIPVATYARLADRFHAEHFDARKIVSFARECGMDYINLTTRHHDGFCLWDASDTPFQCKQTCGRDLVSELYAECEKQHMALFLYYSHGRDWRHPDAPNNDVWGGRARPPYDPPELAYHVGKQHQLQRYVDFIKGQILELLSRFPHIAGIWLDGIAVPQHGPTEQFHIPELYAAIRESSPHALISYKQGITGTEDFFAPEHGVPEKASSKAHRGKIKPDSLLEVCTNIGSSWGYIENDTHKTPDELAEMLKKARVGGYRLLINTGLTDDGSLNAIETGVIKEALRIAAAQRSEE